MLSSNGTFVGGWFGVSIKVMTSVALKAAQTAVSWVDPKDVCLVERTGGVMADVTAEWMAV